MLIFSKPLPGSTKAFWSCHSATTRQSSRWNALLRHSFLLLRSVKEINFFRCSCHCDGHFITMIVTLSLWVNQSFLIFKRVTQFLMSALMKTLHQHCTAAGRTWRSQGLEGRWRLGLRNWQMLRKVKISKPQNFTEIALKLFGSYSDMYSRFLGRPSIPLSLKVVEQLWIPMMPQEDFWWKDNDRQPIETIWYICSFSCCSIQFYCPCRRFLCSHQLACSRPMTSLRPLPVHLKMGSRLEISNCWKPVIATWRIVGIVGTWRWFWCFLGLPSIWKI